MKAADILKQKTKGHTTTPKPAKGSGKAGNALISWIGKRRSLTPSKKGADNDGDKE